MNPIGGFFGLHTPRSARGSLSQLWRLDANRDLFLGNARSALAQFLAVRRARKLWLPAYVCEAAAEGAEAGAASIDFFPVDDALAPDSAFLERRLRRGDFVLAVDYFGRAPGAAFRRLVAARRDVGWIEDRAQALDIGAAAWGEWQLFSPRKLLGVPDGGILTGGLAPERRAQKPLAPPQIKEMLAAQAARLDDPAGRHSHAWFPAYQRSEAAQKVALNAASALTLAIMQAVDAAAMARARRANWRMLHRALAPLAAFRGPPGPSPFGYVIRVRDAGRAQGRLAAKGVFAQRHWARLPSPAVRFPDAHRLAAQLLTLPCDHRYDGNGMRAVARVVRECLD
jgi:dTDP-4-amino-4,6-dideoxygalactose transaminase